MSSEHQVRFKDGVCQTTCTSRETELHELEESRVFLNRRRRRVRRKLYFSLVSFFVFARLVDMIMPTKVAIRSQQHRRTTTSSLVTSSFSVGDELIKLPECSHGPALRFSRHDGKSDASRDFYSCSVTRDRKVCSMFHWVDEWNRKMKRSSGGSKEVVATEQARKKLKHVPDCTFSTIVDNKTNAQFVFDKSTISNVLNIVKKVIQDLSNHRRVLCLGTPTIHRALLEANIDSTLLDEDSRLVNCFPNTYRFNMFNGSWFGESCPVIDDFSAIVCDPPFHPELIQALKNTLKNVFPNSLASGYLIMAFPYFLSRQITEAFPDSIMTDIRLTYANHPKYKTHDRSPVRLFTTRGIVSVLDADFELSGHIYCKLCCCHVSKVNSHCNTCQKCTTNAGKNLYKHCDICRVCVKPNAIHCSKCSICAIGSHSC